MSKRLTWLHAQYIKTHWHLCCCEDMGMCKNDRDVLFEYHRAVVPFCRAVRTARSS